MAIVSKTNKDGIDFVIDNLQQKMYLNLLSFWQVGATYQCYPRANKNYKQENVIPEISLDEKDYKEVLNDDKFSVTSFFLNNDTRVYQDEWGQIKQSISVIFQADLVQLYGATERYDEQFNMDVLRILKKENKYVVDDIEIVEGVDNVFSDLTLTGRLKDNINRTDISQYHCVKFTFSVLYKYKCGDLPSLASVCPAATYRNSDGTFIQSIVSGGSYTAPDVTITINGSPNTLPANKDASYTVTADPAGNTMNGTSLTDIVAGTTKAFTIRYADDSPVTVTTITDNATTFIGEVPNAPTVINTANLYKTGQATSFRTGDDGDLEKGRGTDWFTLDWTNPYYGGNARFRGNTGGYTDGTNWYDVNGNSTTYALAFPDDECLDWAYFDQVNETLPMWYLVSQGTITPTPPLARGGNVNGKSANNAIDESLASTQNGYSDWYCPNISELFSILFWEQNVISTQGLNYKPFEYDPTGKDVAVANFAIVTSTIQSTRGMIWAASNGTIGFQAPSTAAFTYFMKRTATLTDLGL